MNKFPKEQIDATRKDFRNQGFQEVEVNLGNRHFSYFVVPQSLQPKLPNFAMRLTGNSQDGYVLGISDNVDPMHRQYAVAHEYIEFIEIGIDTPNKCITALDEELKLVPEDIKPDYIRMRAEFFRDLVSYGSKKPESFTTDDLRQFRQNATRLEDLMK